MNCLVTGGAGFIGSNLVDKLIELGHSVICIDNESAECHEQFYWNPKANNYKYDICDYEKITHLFHGIDYVFHIASDARIQPAILNPRKSIESNAVGTANVIELSRINKVKRFIYSSTSSAYGKKAILPNIETQPSDPLTPYSTAKVFGENLARVYYNLYGLKTISLRYFNVYGQGQPENGQYAPVIGIFFKQKRNNEPLTINGDGYQSRDFVHVSDVVDANIRSAFLDIDKYYIGQVYNVGSGVSLTINDISNLISTNKVYVDPKIGECKNSLANIDKIYKIFGWKPTIELKQWIKENI